MSQKEEQALATATAEDLKVVSPDEVPETVQCYVSKREIKGADGRLVQYEKDRVVWVHKRFLGEIDVEPEEEDEDEFDFAVPEGFAAQFDEEEEAGE